MDGEGPGSLTGRVTLAGVSVLSTVLPMGLSSL